MLGFAGLCGNASTKSAVAKDAAVLVGAGDIADCRNLAGAQATAKLLEKIPGTVMAVGDLAYPDGTAENFTCYDKTWGREKMRTRPAPGNHEFHSAGAAYYFNYFGAAAGDPSRGYYSYELASWHIVVLNSECADVGGCDADSVQGKWLREDLAAHPLACTLAYFHKPLFSSGGAHGDERRGRVARHHQLIEHRPRDRRQRRVWFDGGAGAVGEEGGGRRGHGGNCS